MDWPLPSDGLLCFRSAAGAMSQAQAMVESAGDEKNRKGGREEEGQNHWMETQELAVNFEGEEEAAVGAQLGEKKGG